jgi:hypothetical protein
MGRFYVVQFNSVAVTAAQDLFEIVVPSGITMALHRVRVSQESDAGDSASEQLPFSLSRGPVGYTRGGGGTSITLVKHLTGDSSAIITASGNNTTRASGLTKIFEEAENVHNGWDYFPAPEHRLYFRHGEACVVGLENAPTDSLTMEGYAIIEELG